MTSHRTADAAGHAAVQIYCPNDVIFYARVVKKGKKLL